MKTITVQQLINELKKYPGNLPVKMYAGPYGPGDVRVYGVAKMVGGYLATETNPSKGKRSRKVLLLEDTIDCVTVNDASKLESA